ncbi:MAG: 3-phosphoshikimate 1-carboxyvinyltransferase [Acutalibacteraceae bacterium]|nr:3-phosphoshikimate 1-carboxyvinyltransferase [Acutalibacteraceae bacterium]
MSSIKVMPSRFKGEVTLPPSKSDVHRAILCASLSRGKSVIAPVDLSQDISATIDCARALGADIKIDGKTAYIDGSRLFKNKEAVLDCRESGSTLRFFIPVACAGGVNATFIGKGRLPQRPIGIYLDCLPKAGVECITEAGLPLKINGTLQAGEFEVPGDVSSQFITGLLLALPLTGKDCKIRITSALQSVGYINMTIRTMAEFGVTVESTDYGYFIKGGQEYKPCNYTCEADWSQAAFFLAAGAFGEEVTLKGLRLDSIQGDKECMELFRQFGADITVSDNAITVKPHKLKGIDIDATQIPDLVPILAVTAAFAEGTTNIYGAERLRIKESDRLNAISTCLNKIGARVTEKPDGLIIDGVATAIGGKVEGYNDHRIVMAMAIAVAKCTSAIEITDKESINKSYPAFFDDYRSIMGKAEEIE